MKPPIPLAVASGCWRSGLSPVARETWHALKHPANARHLLKSIEELKRGDAVKRDLIE